METSETPNSDYVEIEAMTVKEAIKIALKQLNIKKSQAEITILSEEQKGLFGMEGAERAKIRVSVKKDNKSGA